MIDALVRKFLGTAGTGILSFYIEHSIWINALILTYALLVIFARRNYGLVAQSILFEFFQKYGNLLAKKNAREIHNLLLKSKLSWTERIKTGWFPFIALPGGYLLHLKNDQNFQKMFTTDMLVKFITRNLHQGVNNDHD
jgi:hypothetical protein